jgi:hypothetical protein
MKPRRTPVSSPDNARRKKPSNSAFLPVEGISEEYTAQFPCCIFEAQFFRAGSHDHYDVGAWLQLCTVQSKKFTNQTLRPVSLDSTPDLAARRDS